MPTTPLNLRRAPRLAVCLAAALTAAVPASASAGERKPLGSKWRVTNVHIDGTEEASSIGEPLFALKSTMSYRGGRSRRAFEIKLSRRRPSVVTAKPVRYTSTSKATYTSNGVSYDCSYTLPREGAPPGLTAVLRTTPNGIRIFWSLAPSSWNCPEHLAPVDLPPSPRADYTTRHPLRAFTGRRAKLPIRIQSKSGVPLIAYREITWKGTVTFER